MSEPVAWCDDAAFYGGVGNCASAATKRHWEGGEWFDKLLADRMKHPLYAQHQPEALEALLDVTAHLEAAISLLERGGKKAAASDKIFAMMLDDYRKSTARARAILFRPDVILMQRNSAKQDDSDASAL